MSLYLSGLFGLLTVEMAILFLVVLPLPLLVRRKVYSLYYRWTSSRKVLTTIYIFAALVSILFVDSWRRAQFKVWLHHYHQKESADENGSVTPTQALATRAYNQRNVYISGFILYFLVCIPSVFTIIRRLIKYQSLINNIEGKSTKKDTKAGKDKATSSEKDTAGKTDLVDEREIDHLRHELQKKEVDLEGLQKQVKNLENYFDEQHDQKKPKSAASKKNL